MAELGGFGPLALKQLYDSVVPKEQQKKLSPEEFKAELFGQPKTDAEKSAKNTDTNPFSGLDFFKSAFAKQGGSIHHYSKGSTVDDTQSSQSIEERIAALKAGTERQQMQDLKEAFQGLGTITPPINPAQPQTMLVKHAPSSYAPKALPQMSVVPQLAAILQRRGMTLAQGGNVSDQAHPNYNGIPAFRTGGLDGLGGKYVEGKGDGTSDDIAAMLANGEYVFSADVVAALGNGSNKAGASALDQMVSKIRERARSAPPDKLSPDAKSPLEYLKSSSPAKGAR